MLRRTRDKFEAMTCRINELGHQNEVLDELRLSHRATIEAQKKRIAELERLLEACKNDFKAFATEDAGACEFCKHGTGGNTTEQCKEDCGRYTLEKFEWRERKNDEA